MCKRPKYLALLSLMLINLFTLNNATAQIGKALVLDGYKNYFEVTESDFLDFKEALSIEFWVKPNCEEGNKVILSKQWCKGDYGYYVSVRDNKLLWSYSSNGFCEGNPRVETIDDIFDNTFKHICVVHTQYDIKVFVDGLLKATEHIEGRFGRIKNSRQPLRIGVYLSHDRRITNHFSGLLDELRIWQTELNETLIQQRKDIELTGNESGLVLYHKMEEYEVGPKLVLKNSAATGSAFNARPKGITASSPSTISPDQYDQTNVLLGPDIYSYDAEANLSANIATYKNLKWSTNETSDNITVTKSGKYAVEVETELCKFERDTIYVELNMESNPANSTPEPAAIVDALVVNCPDVIELNCGNEFMRTNPITVTGGKPPYSFQWSDRNLKDGYVQPGKYQVTITDAANKKITKNFNISIPNPLRVQVKQLQAATTASSRDGIAIANVNGGKGNKKWNWDNGETTKTASKLFAGEHTVTITDQNGCVAIGILSLELAPQEVMEAPSEPPSNFNPASKTNNPELEMTNLQEGKTIKLRKLFFKADSYEIESTSFPTLDEVFDFLNKNAKVIIEVGGHTNGRPPHDFCDELSTNRAKAVSNYLIQKGIPDSRIKYKGYGKRKPLTTNETSSGRKKNQRVELKILSLGR